MIHSTVNAYGKVNFILKMLGTLPNGYHALESYMQAVSLKDTVIIGWQPEPEGQTEELVIALDPGRSDMPCDRGNLAFRAAELMHRLYHAGIRERIHITVEKHIPVAAGLAGGSADGAAVITGLARLWGLLDPEHPTEAQLKQLEPAAAQLGADLHFCLWAQNRKTSAKAYGTGTELKKAAPVSARLVLLTPAIAVPTKAVYGELCPSDYEQDADPSVGSLDLFEAAASLSEKTAHMLNHLQAPALRLFPASADSLAALQQITLGGRPPICVQLSGSGPTCFAVFEADARATDEETALLAARGMVLADCIL